VDDLCCVIVLCQGNIDDLTVERFYGHGVIIVSR